MRSGLHGVCSALGWSEMDCSMRDGVGWICIVEIACSMDA
jgi:hypothetical protein